MSEDREAPIWEHLSELVVRLRRILAAIAVAALVLSVIPVGLVEALTCLCLDPFASGGIGSYAPLVSAVPKMIIEIVVPKSITVMGITYNVTIMPASAAESFNVLLYTVLLLGVVGASPVIAREVWAYVEPALYPHEKRAIKRAFAVGIVLFLFGAWLGLFIIAPWTVRIMLFFYPYFIPQGYEAIIRVSVSEIVEMAIMLAISTGLVFEIPLVIYYLLAYRVIDPELFSEENMKWAFVGSMVVGAVISPDPSGLGMIILGVLLYIPFYIAVKLGVRAYHRRKEAEERGEELAREEVAVLQKLSSEYRF